MMRQTWLLVLCISWLAGCGRHRKEVVNDDVLSNLTATVHNDRPGHNEQAAGSPSPYDPRSLSPGKDEQPQPTILRAVNLNPPTTPPDPGPDLSPPPPQPPKQPEEPKPPGGQQTGKAEKEKPEDNLVEVVRYFRDEQPDKARERLKGFEPATRQVLGVLLPVLARLAEPGRAGDRPHDCSALLEHLETLSQALRPMAALSIEKMCYCRGIERFGMVDPLPSSHLYQVGGEGRVGDIVQVYVELRNFASLNNGPCYETMLAGTMLIRDQQNRIVSRMDIPARLERSCSARHDGYLSCYFNVPADLPVGDYSLWIVVKDLTGLSGKEAPPHRIAKRSLDFRVRSPGMELGSCPVAGG